MKGIGAGNGSYNNLNMSKKKSFTINRKKWLRGEGDDDSRLLRSTDNKMCCLGFLGKACGISSACLSGRGMPNTIRMPEWPRSLFQDYTDVP